MATRGRKPKPTAIKLLEGNPGKHPLNEYEPVPPKATVKCPSWLLPEAKKEWKRLAPSLEAMGVLTIAQQNLKIMQSFCSEFGLTPATRARIIAAGGGKDDSLSEDPMEKLLKGGWADGI